MSVPRKSSAATRERLLRAAERCFADHGYEGSSLRRITRQAGVNLAGVNYHFSSKRELWLEMMLRRLNPLNAERVRMLQAARVATPAGRPIPLEKVCEAMFLPIAHEFDDGRGSCDILARLAGNAVNVPQSLSKELNRRCLEQIWRLFHTAVRDALPDVPASEIDWKFYFLMSSMIGAMAWQGRQPVIDRGVSCNLESMMQRLAVFVSGGLRANPPAGKFMSRA